MLIALLAAALAQDAFDAHGLALLPGDGDPEDGLATVRAERQTQWSYAFAATFERADEPLVLYTQYYDRLVREVLLDDLTGVHVQAHLAFLDRVAVGVSLPLWFASVGPDGPQGVSAGDLALTVPVGLVLPPTDGGFGLSLVPRVTLPSGANKRFLGNPGVSAGGLLVASLDLGAFGLDANLGADVLPAYTYLNVDGGGFLVAGFAARLNLSDHVAVRGEWVARPSLDGGVPARTETPGEAILAVRGRVPMGLFWAAGASVGVLPGATAARYRLFAGVGWAHKPEPKAPSALLRVLVVDAADGHPLPDAVLEVAGKERDLDADARARVTGLPIDSDPTIAASHPWYEPAETRALLEVGNNDVTLRLKLKPSRLDVRVRTTEGVPVDGEVRFAGPKPTPPGALGEDGELGLGLVHGDWKVTVAPLDASLQTVSRTVSLDPGESKRLDFVLEPARVQVTETQVVLLDKVLFDYDKATLTPESLTLLDEVAAVFAAHPELRVVELQGHTDERGSDTYNLDLSQRRMNAVRDALVARGVEPERLVAKGFGESQPIVPNAQTEEDHAKNRRVEFHIVELGEGAEIKGSDEPAPEEAP